MERIAKYISEKKNTASLNILMTWGKDVEDTYAMYGREHSIIEDACPASFVVNDYFKADFHNTFHEQYNSILFELSDLEQIRHTPHKTAQPPSTGDTQAMHTSKLPDINLPTFTGVHSELASIQGAIHGLDYE